MIRGVLSLGEKLHMHPMQQRSTRVVRIFAERQDYKRYRTGKRHSAVRQSEEIPVVRIGPGPTSDFFSSKSWKDIGANEDTIRALENLSIPRPSHIQAISFAALRLNEAQHVLLADHAGSGKTLSYLVPLLQNLKAEEQNSGMTLSPPKKPRIIVLVPTAELCMQVLRVARALSRTLKFRSAAFTGGRPMRTQKDALEQGVDLAIGTPGRLRELVMNGSLNLDNCNAIVCDEVDVLLGPTSTFAEQVVPLKEMAPEDTRFILVTATLPGDVYGDLELMFPGIVSAIGPGLHRTAPGMC